MKKIAVLLLCLLLLASCGKTPREAPGPLFEEPIVPAFSIKIPPLPELPEPLPYVNPLTGEGCEDGDRDAAALRHYAQQPEKGAAPGGGV